MACAKQFSSTGLIRCIMSADRLIIEPLYDVAVTLIDQGAGNVQITIRNGSRAAFAVLNADQWRAIHAFNNRGAFELKPNATKEVA